MTFRRSLACLSLSIATLLGAAGLTSQASASDCVVEYTVPVYSYRIITVWVAKEVPYWVTVVKHKPCGNSIPGSSQTLQNSQSADQEKDPCLPLTNWFGR